ncbi:flagellar assembly peptidoglycan hydrolase FlgJ [Viridibacterium curvum]|uniref:Peptidoglycan hydrolase FlgJ n=1 Tax=Viridibacterium curvum TaxID=1101404 RepID=A0ABP9Q7X8_9RHOO
MLDPVNIFDPSSLATLKTAAKDQSPEAIKATAKQFEALFLQMVLKTMRESVPQDGMFNSDATRFYQGLSDQQLAAVMAHKGGIGLAAALERQLMQQALSSETDTEPMTLRMPTTRQAQPSTQTPTSMSLPHWTPAATGATANAQAAGAGTPQQFVDALWPQAQDAAHKLDVPPHFLIGQAALETGWGKAEIRRADGQPSYNLFNIKAGKDWQGATVDAQTTEYENGQAVTRTERFRAYSSYAESFADYAQLMQNAPRYASVAGQDSASGFARALQSAGYATDPAYADKLTRVINGTTLRQSLVASAR